MRDSIAYLIFLVLHLSFQLGFTRPTYYSDYILYYPENPKPQEPINPNFFTTNTKTIFMPVIEDTYQSQYFDYPQPSYYGSIYNHYYPKPNLELAPYDYTLILSPSDVKKEIIIPKKNIHVTPHPALSNLNGNEDGADFTAQQRVHHAGIKTLKNSKKTEQNGGNLENNSVKVNGTTKKIEIKLTEVLPKINIRNENKTNNSIKIEKNDSRVRSKLEENIFTKVATKFSETKNVTQIEKIGNRKISNETTKFDNPAEKNFSMEENPLSASLKMEMKNKNETEYRSNIEKNVSRIFADMTMKSDKLVEKTTSNSKIIFSITTESMFPKSLLNKEAKNKNETDNRFEIENNNGRVLVDDTMNSDDYVKETTSKLEESISVVTETRFFEPLLKMGIKSIIPTEENYQKFVDEAIRSNDSGEKSSLKSKESWFETSLEIKNETAHSSDGKKKQNPVFVDGTTNLSESKKNTISNLEIFSAVPMTFSEISSQMEIMNENGTDTNSENEKHDGRIFDENMTNSDDIEENTKYETEVTFSTESMITSSTILLKDEIINENKTEKSLVIDQKNDYFEFINQTKKSDESVKETKLIYTEATTWLSKDILKMENNDKHRTVHDPDAEKNYGWVFVNTTKPSDEFIQKISNSVITFSTEPVTMSSQYLSEMILMNGNKTNRYSEFEKNESTNFNDPSEIKFINENKTNDSFEIKKNHDNVSVGETLKSDDSIEIKTSNLEFNGSIVPETKFSATSSLMEVGNKNDTNLISQVKNVIVDETMKLDDFVKTTTINAETKFSSVPATAIPETLPEMEISNEHEAEESSKMGNNFKSVSIVERIKSNESFEGATTQLKENIFSEEDITFPQTLLELGIEKNSNHKFVNETMKLENSGEETTSNPEMTFSTAPVTMFVESSSEMQIKNENKTNDDSEVEKTDGHISVDESTNFNDTVKEIRSKLEDINTTEPNFTLSGVTSEVEIRNQTEKNGGYEFANKTIKTDDIEENNSSMLNENITNDSFYNKKSRSRVLVNGTMKFDESVEKTTSNTEIIFSTIPVIIFPETSSETEITNENNNNYDSEIKTNDSITLLDETSKFNNLMENTTFNTQVTNPTTPKRFPEMEINIETDTSINFKTEDINDSVLAAATIKSSEPTKEQISELKENIFTEAVTTFSPALSELKNMNTIQMEKNNGIKLINESMNSDDTVNKTISNFEAFLSSDTFPKVLLQMEIENINETDNSTEIEKSDGRIFFDETSTSDDPLKLITTESKMIFPTESMTVFPSSTLKMKIKNANATYNCSEIINKNDFSLIADESTISRNNEKKIDPNFEKIKCPENCLEIEIKNTATVKRNENDVHEEEVIKSNEFVEKTTVISEILSTESPEILSKIESSNTTSIKKHNNRESSNQSIKSDNIKEKTTSTFDIESESKFLKNLLNLETANVNKTVNSAQIEKNDIFEFINEFSDAMSSIDEKKKIETDDRSQLGNIIYYRRMFLDELIISEDLIEENLHQSEISIYAAPEPNYLESLLEKEIKNVNKK